MSENSDHIIRLIGTLEGLTDKLESKITDLSLRTENNTHDLILLKDSIIRFTGQLEKIDTFIYHGDGAPSATVKFSKIEDDIASIKQWQAACAVEKIENLKHAKTRNLTLMVALITSAVAILTAVFK